jgi:aconitate hydratase
VVHEERAPVPATVARTLIDAHRVDRLSGPGGATLELLRPDHVLVPDDDAPLVAEVLASLGARVHLELALVAAERGGLAGGFELRPFGASVPPDLARLGFTVARAGAGSLEPVYRERFAAPGRLVFVVGSGHGGCGALGTLALPVSAIEAAAALAGVPVARERPDVDELRIAGTLPPWCTGQDLAFEIARRRAVGVARGRILEMVGSGVDRLAMADRIAVASWAGPMGALACLFPSDEVTRAWLTSHGREPDWKRLEPPAEEPVDALETLDLDTVEARVAPREGVPRDVRQWGDARITHVLAGPGLAADDVIRFAIALGGAPVAEGVQVTVLPGSRRTFETAGEAGTLARLADAGVRVLESPAPPSTGADGLGLACGVLPVDLDGFGQWMIASPLACAAAARAGRLADPRELPRAALEWKPVGRVAAADAWVAPPAPDGGETAERSGAFPLRPPMTAPLRGEVLLVLGDDVTVDHVLPWGARMEPLLADLPALAGHVLDSVDPAFAARARARGGGFLVAGERFGAGPRRELAAVVLAVAGLFAVLARSHAPGMRSDLIGLGILPLLLPPGDDGGTIASGDELEIPGLPEGLETGKPLEVRNLTQGRPCTVQHDLTPYEVAVVRAGGLVRAMPAMHGAREENGT